MEPLTIAGAGLAVLGSRDILNKLLGPSADYVGGEIAGLVQKCNINLDVVFDKAKDKLGSRIEISGSVNPRVLKQVVDEGRFCEDELAAEYYAGLLASSRSELGKDDRGLPFLALVRGMSSYQLRLHYFVYFKLFETFCDSGLNIGDGRHCAKASMFFSDTTLSELFSESSNSDDRSLLAHSIVGLHSAGLLNSYSYGRKELVCNHCANADGPGASVVPSHLGAELFLWALGIETPDAHKFFVQPNQPLNPAFDIPSGGGACSSRDESEQFRAE